MILYSEGTVFRAGGTVFGEGCIVFGEGCIFWVFGVLQDLNKTGKTNGGTVFGGFTVQFSRFTSSVLFVMCSIQRHVYFYLK